VNASCNGSGVSAAPKARSVDQPSLFERGQDLPDAGGRGVMGATRQLAGHPQDRPVRGRDDLQVHPMPLMRARVEQPVSGDTVDRDQRAVDDHVGHALPLRLPQRLAKLGRPRREQLDGFVDIPPTRRGRDAKPGTDLRERLTFAQIHQHHHGLLTRVERPPHRTQLPTTGANEVGHEGQDLT
jgi:hypothetical protein